MYASGLRSFGLEDLLRHIFDPISTTSHAFSKTSLTSWFECSKRRSSSYVIKTAKSESLLTIENLPCNKDCQNYFWALNRDWSSWKPILAWTRSITALSQDVSWIAADSQARNVIAACPREGAFGDVQVAAGHGSMGPCHVGAIWTINLESIRCSDKLTYSKWCIC